MTTATKTEILRELTLLGARFPGQLPAKAAAVWADDLERLGFERADLAEAGRQIAHDRAHQLEESPERFWRLELALLIQAARKARSTRIEQQRAHGARLALPEPSKANRDPLRVRAFRLTAQWVGRCMAERRTVDEEAFMPRANATYAVLQQAQQLGCTLSDEGVEAALAAEALGRALRKLCTGPRRAA